MAIFNPGPARLPGPVPAAGPGARSPPPGLPGRPIWYSGILVFRYSRQLSDNYRTTVGQLSDSPIALSDRTLRSHYPIALSDAYPTQSGVSNTGRPGRPFVEKKSGTGRLGWLFGEPKNPGADFPAAGPVPCRLPAPRIRLRCSTYNITSLTADRLPGPVPDPRLPGPGAGCRLPGRFFDNSRSGPASRARCRPPGYRAGQKKTQSARRRAGSA